MPKRLEEALERTALEGGNNNLDESLLPPAEAESSDAAPAPAAAQTAEQASEDRRSLIVSVLTLALSIPALIGA